MTSEYLYSHIKPYIRKYIDIYIPCDICGKIRKHNKVRCKHGTLYCDDHKMNKFKFSTLKMYNKANIYGVNSEKILLNEGKAKYCNICKKNKKDNIDCCFFKTTIDVCTSSPNLFKINGLIKLTYKDKNIVQHCCSEYKKDIENYYKYDKSKKKIVYLEDEKVYYYKKYLIKCENCSNFNVRNIHHRIINHNIYIVCKTCNNKIMKYLKYIKPLEIIDYPSGGIESDFLKLANSIVNKNSDDKLKKIAKYIVSLKTIKKNESLKIDGKFEHFYYDIKNLYNYYKNNYAF